MVCIHELFIYLTSFLLYLICFIVVDIGLFPHCSLEDLWFNDNQLATLDGIAEAVSGSREKLTTIYLERNPCVSISYILQSSNYRIWFLAC